MRLRPAVLTALLSSVLATALSPVGAQAAVDPGTGTSYETAPVVVPLLFPVQGRLPWSDTFLTCRSGCARMHMGQDLSAPKMTPLLAAFDGVVTSLQRDRPSGNTLVLTADRGPSAGWSVLYLHVNNDTPGTDDGLGSARYAFPAGLEVGSRVLAGQLVGWVGDSGNAESTGPHLHVELRRGQGWSGTVYNASPSLRAAPVLRRARASGPHPTGSLLRHPSGALFLLQGPNDAASKHLVSPTVLATLGRSEATAVAMTTAESLGYRTGAPAVPRDGSVVRDPGGTTWLVAGGTRAQAPLPALAVLGLAAPRVHPVRDADLAGLPVAPTLPGSPYYPGALVRPGGRLAQVGADGLLHAVSPAVAASHGWVTRDVAVLPEPVLPEPVVPEPVVPEPVVPEPVVDEEGLLPDPGPTGPPAFGDPLPLRDGTLVVTAGPRVGIVSAGAFRRLWDSRQVADHGYGGRPRQVVPAAELAGLREAALTAR